MKRLAKALPIIIILIIPAAVLGPSAVMPGLGTPTVQSIPSSNLLPPLFAANKGQLDARADYYIAGRGRAVFFGPGGIFISLTGPVPSEDGLRDSGARAADVGRWTVEQEFVGANPAVRPEGGEKARAVLSYFKGGPEDWRAGVPTYARLTYRDLWPGVDLVYSSGSDRLKYEFVVRPGADPAAIKLRYKGATRVALRGDGRVEVMTPVGSFEDDVPAAYQEREGRREAVAAAFALQGATCRFELGEYDPARPLVIDPAVIIYAGYIGGGADDRGAAVARDAAGNAYITGATESISFPVEVGPDLSFNSSVQAPDAFVAKVNAAGTELVYCGYIGGSVADAGTGIAVDGAGNAYVAGWTQSLNFPVTVGPGLTYHGGNSQYSEGFVAKVSADGTELLYSGFIGGTASDGAAAIALDGSGNAYVAGWTESDDLSRAVGPDLTFNGGRDAFVAKVNAAGSGFVYSGYLGGSADDEAAGVAVDGQGRAVIAGTAVSRPSENFPVVGGPDLTHAGGQDGFAARVNAAGTGLEYCGYVGGSGNDVCLAVAVDADGASYVAGATSSQYQFPATVGPDLSYSGSVDAFVAKITASGGGFDFCGYIGGAGEDQAMAVAVDEAGNVYVAGFTDSASGFPVNGGPELFPSGLRDAFLVTVKPSGDGLFYGGYIGGSYDDEAAGVAVDGLGNIWLAGYTRSSDFPVIVGPYLTPGGGFNISDDAFAVKVSEDLPPAIPTNLRASAATVSSISLAWDDESDNEDGFEVERKTGAEGTWSLIETLDADVEAYTDDGLLEATVYYYRVRAYNDIGESAYSDEAELATVPAAPTGLAATAVSSRRVELSWADHSDGETGFRVERRTGAAGVWAEAGSTGADITAYADRQVLEETTYDYRVFAVNAGGDSAPSNIASVTTPVLTIPEAPTNLQATASSSFTIDLSWADNSYDEDGFRIERKTGVDGTWAEITAVGTDVATWQDTGLEDETTYYYRVRAHNNAGQSPYSNESGATTPEYRPRLRVPVAGIAFGNVNICTAAVMMTTLYNDGTAPLLVTAVNRTSGAAELTYALPAAPFTIPASGSQAISVRFAPLDAVASNATFTVLSDDPDNPSAAFAVSGTGFLPAITVALGVERLTERAWIIRRDYARLTVTVTKAAPFSVTTYRLSRRTSTSSYETLRNFTEADFTSGVLIHNDTFLAAGTSYFYRIDALDCLGRTIASSSESGPAAPPRVSKSRARTIRRVP